MIETIREIIRINRLDEQFEDALDSRDGRSRYQRAMAFLSDNLGPQRVRSVVERSVQRARRVEDEKPPSRELEDDLEYWYLNTGTAALGEIISKHSDQLASVQLTVNFDPLLHVAVRLAGGQVTYSVLSDDGTVPDEEGEIPGSVRIVHLHGFWRGDTMHTVEQLTTARDRLRKTLGRILEKNLVVVVGYSGWDDVFTRSLADVVQDAGTDVEVVWSCYSEDERSIRNEFSSLFSRLRPAILKGRFKPYCGVDCHWLFPELLSRLDSGGAQPIIAATRATPRVNRETAASAAATREPYQGGPSREHFDRALRIITQHGDTDIFPFPVENTIFSDRPEQIVALLEELHGDFNKRFTAHRGLYESDFVAAGYFGFRRGTQIDPLWNAYLLGLIVSIGSEIEAERIPISHKVVFSYRFQLDEKQNDLFVRGDPLPGPTKPTVQPMRGVGWTSFHRHSIELARRNEITHVATCDIADFYRRVRHEELREVLFRLDVPDETIERIRQILARLSGDMPHGLPIGGDASRLLSELLLNWGMHLTPEAPRSSIRALEDYSRTLGSFKSASPSGFKVNRCRPPAGRNERRL